MGGLLEELLLLPLAPARSVVWLAEKIRVQAEEEYAGRQALSDRLAEIERARTAGEISDEDSAELEEQILEELEW